MKKEKNSLFSLHLFIDMLKSVFKNHISANSNTIIESEFRNKHITIQYKRIERN